MTRETAREIPQEITEEPGLIALDWGTSSLRAYLIGAVDGAVLDRGAEDWGVTRVPDGDFAAAFDTVTRAWRARWPGLHAIASGMVGSSRGWVEVPYCSCPAGIDELAAALASAPGSVLHVVPGLMRPGDAPDVMRGEETEVVGALALRPELAERSLLVLPGTHSKWVTVAGGRVRGFATYMTGELFATLRDHSILGGAARDVRPDVRPDAATADATTADVMTADAAFARGVAAARASAGGLAPLLFSARTLVVTGRLAAGASLEYLSGMLIGDELRCGLTGAEGDGPRDAALSSARPIALVGDAALCRRYAAAFGLWGIEHVIVDGAAPAGLWRIARRAGLVAPAGGGA